MADDETLSSGGGDKSKEPNAGTATGASVSNTQGTGDKEAPKKDNDKNKEIPKKENTNTKQQQEKYEYATSDKQSGGNFLNYALACVDEGEDSYTIFNNEQSLKIVCFFVPKFKKGLDMLNVNDIVKLPYSEMVKEIVLEDKLDSIGISGSIVTSNTGSVLEGIFERHNNYYLVINITEKVGQGSIKYEPYICEITSVQNITKLSKKEKLVKINFCDIITSILTSHSIASFIKFEGNSKITKECKSYKELFEKIINYVKRYIRINSDNFWEYKKDVLYGSATFFEGNKIMNGYDEDLSLNELITASFNKIDRNASIYEALQVFLRDCVTSIKMTDQLKAMFEEIGDVLIPFFFKEEYQDTNAVYYNLWNEGKTDETDKSQGSEDSKKTKDDKGGGGTKAAPAESGTGTKQPDPAPIQQPDGSNNSKQGGGNGNEGNTGDNQPKNVPVSMAEDSGDSDSQGSTTGDGDKNKDDNSTLNGEASAKQGSSVSSGSGDKSGEKDDNGKSKDDNKKDETQESDKKIASRKEVTASNYGGKSQTLALRHITMRDFFMPFYLCFTYKHNGLPIIWEDINHSDSPVIAMNGKIQDNLQSLTFNSIDKSSVDKHWKNAVFLDASVDSSGTNCTLIFFDWFYRFFLSAFLNSSLVRTATAVKYVSNGGNKNFISNVIPDFYLFSLLNKVGFAENSTDKTFNNVFDEYNSYTVALTSGDTVNEALREMGKNIASFVLLNDSYSFSLKGNLLRRPNEIMRLNIGDLFNGGDSQLNIFTNLSADSSLYVYVKKVTHVFRGSEYVNGIIGSKICESL